MNAMAAGEPLSESVLETEVLIVGAGPAGASSAVFLGRHGIDNVVISRHRSTADTPRAHITNQRAMECLRDAGLEDACLAAASPNEHMAHTFWLDSMAGQEYARIYSWGNDPARKGDYELASPCRMSDLPQTYLEPILVGAAAQSHSHVRFSTELLSFTQDDNGVTARVRDRLTGARSEIRARYMLGADGARSRVVEQLGLPLTGRHGLGQAFNVYCEADLSRYTKDRPGSLYWVLQPDAPEWSLIGNFRMVRPWNKWLVTLFVAGDGADDPTQEMVESRLRQLIGDEEIPVKVHSTFRWEINEVIAERYREGRVLCLGDAVHRHPPSNGLGSNTCVQDSFNLAWKLALVLRGKAAPTLLDSFDAERRPVGAQVVARANDSMRHNGPIWDVTGVDPQARMTADERRAVVDVLSAPTAEGARHRAQLYDAVDATVYELHAHGVELNQRYRSRAVVGDGTPEPVNPRDPELYYQPTTWPGARLPHVWLGSGGPTPRISSLDLTGKQRFVLLTGIGGEPWADAAAKVTAQTGVTVDAYRIGRRQDIEDLYGDWRRIRGVEETGCVLVRPDHVVAWRSPTLVDSPADALADVMRRILGHDGPTT